MGGGITENVKGNSGFRVWDFGDSALGETQRESKRERNSAQQQFWMKICSEVVEKKWVWEMISLNIFMAKEKNRGHKDFYISEYFLYPLCKQSGFDSSPAGQNLHNFPC